MFKRIFSFIIVIITGFVLVACQNSNIDPNDQNLITSIYLEDGSIFVSFDDNTNKNLGKPFKNIDDENEVGITNISFDQSGRIVVTYSNDESEILGHIIGTIGDPVEFELKNGFIRWRFKGSNDNYQNLISIGMLTSQDLRDNLDVTFIIEDNQLKWKDIDDNQWNQLTNYLSLGAMLGFSDISIRDIVINENDQALIILEDGTTFTLDLPFAYYTITFKDDSGNILKEEKVVPGFDATAPDVNREGFDLSWDKAFNNVDSDLVVNLVATPVQRETYTLSFDFDNVDSITVYPGLPIGVLPVVEKDGHIFVKWVDSNGVEVVSSTVFNYLEDITLTPIFNVGSYYRINVFTLRENGEYGLHFTSSKVGEPGKSVHSGVIAITGYHLNLDLSNQTDIVLSDGSLELNLYFDNDVYQISFDFEGLDPIDVLYGNKIGELPEPILEDHMFMNWVDGNGNIVLSTDVFRLENNIELTPVFLEGAEYTIRYFKNDNLLYTEEGFVEDRTTIVADFAIPHGYKVREDSQTSGLVLIGRRNLFDIYFVPDSFTINWLDIDGNLITTNQMAYDSLIVGTATPPYIEGYQFEGWLVNGEVFEFIDFAFGYVPVVGDMDIKATYSIKEVIYYVSYYYLDSMDNYQSKAADETIPLSALAFSDVETEMVNVKGYTFLEDVSSLVATLTGIDYAVRLKLYYLINSVNVDFVVDNQIIESRLVNYGDEVLMPNDPVKENHTFSGWYLLDDKITEPIIAGAVDIRINGVFEETLAYYYIEYYFEDLDGEYKYKGGVRLTASVGTNVHIILLEDLDDAPIELPNYLEFDHGGPLNVTEGIVTENVIIPNVGTEGLVLKAYYNLIDVALIYRVGDRSYPRIYKYGDTVDIGDDINIDWEARRETFNGWMLSHLDEPQLIIPDHQLLKDTTVYSSVDPFTWTLTLIDGADVYQTFDLMFEEEIFLPRLADQTHFNRSFDKFIGWMDENNVLHEPLFFTLNVEEDITLYAMWNSSQNVYSHEVINNKAYITEYTGKNIEEKIPYYIGGYKVYGIRPGAFSGNPYLQKILLTSVIVETDAFENMPRLKTVETADFIISATENSYNITWAVQIESNAFRGSNNIEVVNMGGSRFLTLYPYAFANLPSLREVNMPMNLLEIPDFAFYNNPNLETVTQQRFSPLIYLSGPNSMGKVTNIMERIGVSAFEGATKLTSVFDYEHYPEGNWNSGPLVAGTGADVFEHLITIERNAFKDTGLEVMTLPNSLVTIGANAFENTNISAIEFGSLLKTIEFAAFRNTKIEYLEIPDNVSQLMNEAFYGIDDLKVVRIMGNSHVLIPYQTNVFGSENNDGFIYAYLGRGVNTFGNAIMFETTNENFRIYTENTIVDQSFATGKTIYKYGEWRWDTFGHPYPNNG